MTTIVEIEPWKLRGTLIWRAPDPGLVTGPHPDGFDDWEPKQQQQWRTQQHQPVLDWLAELGLEQVRALAMFQSIDGRYLLAVNQLCVTDEGQPYLDFASDCVATRYRVLDLGPDVEWPELFDIAWYRVEAGKWI